MLLRIFRAWLRWRKDWDSLCNCCGKCCYIRTLGADGQVVIHYDNPCEHLDTETHLCRVFDDRFRKCDHCGKVNLFTVLFNPTLPKDCTYVQTFRLWEDKEEPS
ncbi:MAG: hypothetical protein LUD83_01640 [Clostridiales bacterium]|nr:hypothetical protein [Clostridiales bacterium]